VGATDGLPTPANPSVYAPRVMTKWNRKEAECRGADLLLLGNRVRCERVGGGAPAGPWTVVLQAPRMTRVQQRRAHLTAVDGRPAFALVDR
jgi:hypothetical protein